MQTGETYWALRLMATINSAIGWILIALGVFVATTGGVGGVVGIAGGLGVALVGTAWVAGSQLITVLIDIEKNTRALRPIIESDNPSTQSREWVDTERLCKNCGHAYGLHVAADGIRPVPCESGNCGCKQFAAL
jgi:hypothetical protein